MIDLYYVYLDEDTNRELIDSGELISRETGGVIHNISGLKHEIGYRLLQIYMRYELNDKSHFLLDKTETGKPFLKDFKNVRFNISHSKNLVILGVCEEEIGVDCETVRVGKETVAERIFTKIQKEIYAKTEDKNLYFTRIWTLKESFVKCIGTGIGYPLNEIEVYIDENDILVNNMQDYYFDQMEIFHNIVSVCTSKKHNISKNDYTESIYMSLMAK